MAEAQRMTCPHCQADVVLAPSCSACLEPIPADVYAQLSSENPFVDEGVNTEGVPRMPEVPVSPPQTRRQKRNRDTSTQEPTDPPKARAGRGVRREPQIGMGEQTIADEDLMEAIGDYLDHQEAAKAFNGAKARMKAKFKDKPEGRYRVGPYVVPINHRTGGGISIPTWEANVIGKIEGP